MELFIETLTGAAFELRVSPFETIISVKAKIQRLEGIPVSQQHLIWQSVELEDDYSLHDYRIHPGATLKLVLAMRGGPINTRRIPMEDQTFREMVDYVEANKEEFWEKLPGCSNRNVTLLVFREGNQLNFFRVVDRGDGTLTPLSESLSGASVYNFNEDEEEEEGPAKEKVEENDKLKAKVQELRLKMESLNLTKKPIKKPRPPSTGLPSNRIRMRHLPSSGKNLLNTLNKNPLLPPVGQAFRTRNKKSCIQPTDTTMPPISLDKDLQKLQLNGKNITAMDYSKDDQTSSSENEELAFSPSDGEKNSPEQTDTSFLLNRQSNENFSRNLKVLDRLRTDTPHNILKADSSFESQIDSIPPLGKKNGKLDPVRNDESLLGIDNHKDIPKNSLGREKLKEPFFSNGTVKLRKKRKDRLLDDLKDALGHSTACSNNSRPMKSPDSVGRPLSSSRCDWKNDFSIESLSNSEACAVSGMLRQASLEKLGTSHIGNFLGSGSKAKFSENHSWATGNMQDAGGIQAPDRRLVSSHLQRLSNAHDSQTCRLSPHSHNRLPPVKAKKKVTKRCLACGKKTGLASSYQCRCGSNFCAVHRYAESHNCTYDYKTEGRNLLEQTNPVISAPKLPKI